MSETHGNPSDPHSHGPPVLPEPKTPMWLPALGGVLFLTVGLIWGLMPSSAPAATDGTAPAASAAPAGPRDAGAAAPH
jgi:hypothetical protein